MNAYIDGCGLAGDQKGPLFRTIARGRGELTTTPQPQANAYTMIGRRAAGAGIETKIGNHTFRATGLSKCCGIQHGHKTVNFDSYFLFSPLMCVDIPVLLAFHIHTHSPVRGQKCHTVQTIPW